MDEGFNITNTDPAPIADPDDEVGYCKPPKQHQFKKGGKSPNPKGRPKGAKGLKALVCAAAEAPAEYVLNGKKIKGTRIEVMLHQLSLKGMQADMKAIDKMTQLYGHYGPPSQVDESMIDPESDAAALEQLVALAAKFKLGTAK